jgi:hypothetical protein
MSDTENNVSIREIRQLTINEPPETEYSLKINNEAYKDCDYHAVYSSVPLERFWRFICPCGVEAVVPLNRLPEVDTPFPCGHPRHKFMTIKSKNG